MTEHLRMRPRQRLQRAECERDESASFCIGVVTGIAADSVGVHQFNVVAVWDSSPTTVPFDEITQVRFGDRYANVYSHYVDDVPPK